MEKLKELLKTFEEEKVEKLKSDVWGNDTISPRIWTESDITIYNKLQVISKEFLFIKWLIENDKIDLEELDYEIRKYNSYIDSHWYYDALLILLAIQDNPIEFLISILK